MNKKEKELLEYFGRLPAAEKATLLSFAEFLAARAPATAISEPQTIPRPSEETVIGAVKRLSATYPMLDRSKMLHETSALVSQHLLQGRAADVVIDELEVVFRRHYERMRPSDADTE